MGLLPVRLLPQAVHTTRSGAKATTPEASTSAMADGSVKFVK